MQASQSDEDVPPGATGEMSMALLSSLQTLQPALKLTHFVEPSVFPGRPSSLGRNFSDSERGLGVSCQATDRVPTMPNTGFHTPRQQSQDIVSQLQRSHHAAKCVGFGHVRGNAALNWRESSLWCDHKSGASSRPGRSNTAILTRTAGNILRNTSTRCSPMTYRSAIYRARRI